MAIVTGSGRGIGREIARRMAAEGARVALASRTASQLEETAKLITDSDGTALVVPTYVANAQQVEELRRTCVGLQYPSFQLPLKSG